MSNTTTDKPARPSAAIEYDFDADLDYFIANQDELVKLYDGKVLIIRNEHVERACDTILQACAQGDRMFGAGNFSIRKCIPGEEAYTARIPSVRLTGGRATRS